MESGVFRSRKTRCLSSVNRSDRIDRGDQLRRAGTSIPLNIAEGAGEWAQNEKCRFYRIAKRSATECVGIISVCRKLEAIEEQLYQEIRKLLIRVVAMLTKMAKKGT